MNQPEPELREPKEKKIKRINNKICENDKKIKEVLDSNLHESIKRVMLNSLYIARRELFEKMFAENK